MNRCDLINHLFRPVYVIQMGWNRMGTKAKYEWVHKLQIACIATAVECDAYLIGHADDA